MVALGPKSALIVLQLMLKVVVAWVNVHVQLAGVCGPLTESLSPGKPNVHSYPESIAMTPDALVLATELVDLSVSSPLQVAVNESLVPLTNAHVVTPSPEKDVDPETDLPSALVLPMKSLLGHAALKPKV